MDPRRSAQDVLLCDLCETDPVQNYCELCHTDLCSNCVSKHLSDYSKRHNVVSYFNRKFTPKHAKCLKHTEKDCELYCEECDVPVCTSCLVSGKHKSHDVSDILGKLSSKKQRLQKDLYELENKIYPRYEEMASNAQKGKAETETNYLNLSTAADQHGEILQRQITAFINRRKSDIKEKKNKHLAVLQKHTDEITHTIAEIKRVILKLKNILDSNDISLTFTYRSRNDEFNELPSETKVTMPRLSTPTIKTEKLDEMFGTLSSLSLTTVKPMLVEPRLAGTINTGFDRQGSVSCLNEEQVWTCGNNKIMKLLNLQGKLLTSIQTKSGNEPFNIAVTRAGDLVYTDYNDKTVNLVKNNQIETMIRLDGWRPRSICSTSADDLLIIMTSDDERKSIVARYSGYTKKQSIQSDDQGRPLYSSENYPKNISENRNLDVCVADFNANAVVVVNQSGKLRFRYTGHPSNTKKSFHPAGIATDSQGHILTADWDSHRIHILDQDGQFLRYIQNRHFHHPNGLCVDTRDNLFVSEFDTAKVKKIRYR